MAKNGLRSFLRAGYERARARFVRPGQPKSSLAHAFDAALGDKEVEVQPELERGLAQLQRGDWDGAESVFRGILQSRNDHAAALHFLGLVQVHRENLDDALKLIRRSVEIDPGNAAAYSNLGNIYKALNQIDDALECYRRAVTIDGGMIDALNNQGVLLAELGRHMEAMACYERALAISPARVNIMVNRAALLMSLMKHEEALKAIESILAIDPGNVHAMRSRGLVLAALSRYQEALNSISLALESQLADEQLYLCRGDVYVAMGRFDEALDSYESALAINQNSIEGALRRCAALVRLKRSREALVGYDLLLEKSQDNVEALFNRGLLLIELGEYSRATSCYDKVLALRPDFPEAYYNRGLALWRDQAYDEALASCDQAILLRPDYFEAFFVRGAVLTRLNRKADALAAYDRAVEINSKDAGAFNNRGMLLMEARRHDEALASFDRALAIMPDSLDALANRGGVFRALGLHERAAQDFRRLLEIDPEYPYALGNKLNSDLHTCNWKEYDVTREKIIWAVRGGKRASFPFSYLVMSDSAEEQLQCTRTYVSHKHPPAASPLYTGTRYKHQKIRLAYLSGDFHGHATAYLMAELFEKHDRRKFEVSAWSFGPELRDVMRERLRTSFDQFNDVRHLSDLEVARQLRHQEIDIAVDLKGYTKDSRPGILSYRPAPIQVNYLVYPGTMGADYIDYIIADNVVIPEMHERFYSEKIVRLPDSYQVNDSTRAISEHTPSRMECGLPKSGFVFCCFNKNYKIVPEIFDIWMRLLHQIDGSVLWLFEDSPAACRNLRAEAASRGVDPKRLVFAPHVPLSDHLARHRLADLFLDTLPCNAHTTASDALWAGLPVLTCIGNAFPGRVAASLLRSVGLPELVASSLADYEKLALTLAKTPTVLSELKRRLALNRFEFPLFNIDRSRQHVELAYTMMYERHQRGDSAQCFNVPVHIVSDPNRLY